MANGTKIWTIIELVKWGSDYFTEKGIDSPRLTVELLLSHVLKLSRIELYTNFQKPLNETELSSLKECIKRRVNHEPLQYIIGNTDFHGLDIKLDNSVLIPRPETEFLVSFVTESEKNRTEKLKILDIGTGSGCIAIALAKFFPNSVVSGIDISESALEKAKENSEVNDVNNINFRRFDVLAENFLNDEIYDIIVSNPPYISKNDYPELEPEVRTHEPKSALTDESDGLTFYRRFSEIFGKILAPNGSFYLEIGFGQSEDILKIFRDVGFELKFRKDYSGIDRIGFFQSGR